MRNPLNLALKLGRTGARREADWVDLIGADTFGAIFLSSALRPSGLRAVVAGGRAHPRVCQDRPRKTAGRLRWQAGRAQSGRSRAA
jgi:hypothetical protein